MEKANNDPVMPPVPESFAEDGVLRASDEKADFKMPLLVENTYRTGEVRDKLNGGGSPLAVHTGHGWIRFGKS